MSAAAGRRSACRKPIPSVLSGQASRVLPRTPGPRPPAGGARCVLGALGRTGLDAHPRLRLGDELAQLGEHELGGGAPALERLDPFQPPQHRPRLVHLPNVAAVVHRSRVSFVPSSYTRAVIVCPTAARRTRSARVSASPAARRSRQRPAARSARSSPCSSSISSASRPAPTGPIPRTYAPRSARTTNASPARSSGRRHGREVRRRCRYGRLRRARGARGRRRARRTRGAADPRRDRRALRGRGPRPRRREPPSRREKRWSSSGPRPELAKASPPATSSTSPHGCKGRHRSAASSSMSRRIARRGSRSTYEELPALELKGKGDRVTRLAGAVRDEQVRSRRGGCSRDAVRRPRARAAAAPGHVRAHAGRGGDSAGDDHRRAWRRQDAASRASFEPGSTTGSSSSPGARAGASPTGTASPSGR